MKRYHPIFFLDINCFAI